MFSNIRLKARLYTSLFFLLVFVLLAVWFVFTQVENIVNEEVPKQEAVLEMEIKI